MSQPDNSGHVVIGEVIAIAVFAALVAVALGAHWSAAARYGLAAAGAIVMVFFILARMRRSRTRGRPN